LSQTRPILSIITPVLNGAAFLKRLLESVASGGAAPGAVEHIVMDGGSTDGSLEIIEEFAPALAHWETGSDAGQSDAINKGVARASGEWATWINADDWYEPGALGVLINRLRADPGLDVLVGRARFLDERGHVIWKPVPPDPVTLADLLRLRSTWFAGRSIAQPEVVFRRSLFEQVGGLNLDNHYSMDHELWLRFAEQGARFGSIDTLVANVGVHARQKTADNRETARAVVRFARPVAERARESLGEAGSDVLAELDEIERRVAIADAMVEGWEAAPGPARAPDLKWLRAVRAHTAGIRRHVLRKARRVLGREGASDVLLIAHDPEGVEDEVRDELGPWSRLEVASPHAVLESPMESPEAVVLDTCLFASPDPRSLMTGLAASLRPGGVLVVTSEPMPSGHMDEYLRWLRKLLLDRITADGAHFLGKTQDLVLERIHEPGLAGLLSAPGARGIDLPGLARGIELELTGFAYRGAEGLDFIPHAPFRVVGRGRDAPAAGWHAAAWRLSD